MVRLWYQVVVKFLKIWGDDVKRRKKNQEGIKKKEDKQMEKQNEEAQRKLVVWLGMSDQTCAFILLKSFGN